MSSLTCSSRKKPDSRSTKIISDLITPLPSAPMPAGREMDMKTLLLLGAAAVALVGCGQSNENAAANSTANSAAAEKPKPAYCFFKDSETKDWAAKRGKDGNIAVTGKAYREDSRYKAILNPP